MTVWLLLPLTIGFCIVAQGVLNRQMASATGLTFAGLFNAILLVTLSVFLFITAKWRPDSLPESLTLRAEPYQFALWHLVPGLAGFVIVYFTPMSIRQLGAAQTYILIITAQILLSVLWDQWVQPNMLSPVRIFGLILVILGSGLYSFSK